MVGRIHGLKTYFIGNSRLSSKISFNQHKLNNFLGLMKAAEGCSITKWPLPGNKLEPVMRMTNDHFAMLAMILKGRRGANIT